MREEGVDDIKEKDSENYYNRQSRNVDEVFCRTCGVIIHKEAEICPKCGVRQRATPSQYTTSGLVIKRSVGRLIVWAVVWSTVFTLIISFILGLLVGFLSDSQTIIQYVDYVDYFAYLAWFISLFLTVVLTILGKLPGTGTRKLKLPINKL